MHRGLRVGQVSLAFFLLFFALGSAALAEDSPSPFRDIPFDAARKLARKKHKVVLVDFFTTWCVPCRLLDTTTWQDPGVAALLRDKTVALRIDAEQETDLARRYGVQAYPTVVLVKPDGTVIDRLVGYQDAKAFTANFNSALAGRTSLVRARDAVEKATGDLHATVDARYRLGDELARGEKYSEALAEYLWCYDEGMVQVPAFAGVRASFLLSSIASLGRRYPPALDALRQRRDDARQRLEKEPPDRQAGSDFANLNHCLGEDRTTLAYFDRLPPDAPQRETMGYYLFDLLVEARRYPDALTAVPYARFKQTFGYMASQIRSQDADGGSGSSLSTSAIGSLRDFIVRSGSKQLEALAGTGQLDDARTLLKAILAIDSSSGTVTLLRARLERAGHAELASGLTPTRG